jgi:hypothetical protein
MAGKVREPAIDRFRRKFVVGDGSDPCWNWVGFVMPNGYGKFSFGREHFLAHRSSWHLLRGPIPDGMCVLHKCDNRRCVNPDHLFVGSEMDNTQDMIAKGRNSTGDRHWSRAKRSAFMRRVIEPGVPKRRGSLHGNAKLTEEDVRAIRRRVAAGETRLAVSRSFSVTNATVCGIVNRRSWKHVD